MLYMLHVFLSALQASDVTEYLSSVECDVLPVLQSLCQGTLVGADWWPEDLLPPPSHYPAFLVSGSQSEPGV